ncbi:MAG TPA: restriction endonuclease [Cytophagales bacterium]|nr:restriction endonuclease [Cytophagales bacterium]HAP60761.1 restriction endonuclease [Cytophagales bacterium]
MSKKEIRRIKPFNPLDKTNLGENVAEALLNSKTHNLPIEEEFIGAGIYAIYYKGDFSLYEPISGSQATKNSSPPIYVGKAVPAGARKGGFGLGEDPGNVLFKRLGEHSKSISQATNLNLEDFVTKFLVVDDIWIPLAESLLIETFNPLWNKVIDGFGNHDPGKGRYQQRKSHWDILHPGRSWAEKLLGKSLTIAEVQNKVESFFNEKS